MIAASMAAILGRPIGLCAEDQRPLRLAISADTLAGANVSDARAAYLVWLREVARHYPVQTAVVVPDVFIPSDELIREVRQGSLDCYGFTAPELAKLLDLTEPSTLVLQDYLADGMQYVLLVHRNSAFKKLADLRGAHVVSHLHRDMVLAPAWLGTILASNGLAQAEHFFSRQTVSDKINQVVLPVFFRRVEAACLVRQSWETAVELNPQLGRDLVALAVSPKLIPIGFGFRRNTSPEMRKALVASILNISSYAAGQQIVALYQSRAFALRPLSVMNPTLDMLREFERVSVQGGAPHKGAS
jgi:ABC-type phosphate/phosphonate transport system substrate-binding protein